MAEQFALAGATEIVITGRSIDALDETKTAVTSAASGCKVIPVAADVTSESDVERRYDTLTSISDVLLNNAGVSLSQQHITDSDPELWWRDWEVNVKGVYLVTQAYLKRLQTHKSQHANAPMGVIINTSSSVSDLVSPNMSSYGTSKMAINCFTEAVQLEYGGEADIACCLAFHPGGVASSGMGQTALEQFRKRLINTVELAAGTALYLSTPAASYLDGRFVYSNWDMERVETL